MRAKRASEFRLFGKLFHILGKLFRLFGKLIRLLGKLFFLLRIFSRFFGKLIRLLGKLFRCFEKLFRLLKNLWKIISKTNLIYFLIFWNEHYPKLPAARHFSLVWWLFQHSVCIRWHLKHPQWLPNQRHTQQFFSPSSLAWLFRRSNNASSRHK